MTAGISLIPTYKVVCGDPEETHVNPSSADIVIGTWKDIN